MTDARAAMVPPALFLDGAVCAVTYCHCVT